VVTTKGCQTILENQLRKVEEERSVSSFKSQCWNGVNQSVIRATGWTTSVLSCGQSRATWSWPLTSASHEVNMAQLHSSTHVFMTCCLKLKLQLYIFRAVTWKRVSCYNYYQCVINSKLWRGKGNCPTACSVVNATGAAFNIKLKKGSKKLRRKDSLILRINNSNSGSSSRW
jgi:hypothetical protein